MFISFELGDVVDVEIFWCVCRGVLCWVIMFLFVGMDFMFVFELLWYLCYENDDWMCVDKLLYY